MLRLELAALIGLAAVLPLLEAPKNLLWLLYVVVWIANRLRAGDFGGRWDRWDSVIAAWIGAAFAAVAFAGLGAEWRDCVDVVRYGSVLWIGTPEGLGRIRGGSAMSLARGVGPQTETVLRILKDRHDNYWFTTNRGLFQVRVSDLDDFADAAIPVLPYKSYGIADGLRTPEFNGGNTNAGVMLGDGSLWFPSIRGIVRVDPAAIPTNPVEPPVLVEQVTGKPMGSDDYLAGITAKYRAVYEI